MEDKENKISVDLNMDDDLTKSTENLSKIIRHLEKNPHTMREVFFIELLIAFDSIDETLKKRIIGLNGRLQSMNKSLSSLSNFDKKLNDNFVELLNDNLKQIINEFNTTLDEIKTPIMTTNNQLIDIGKAYLSLEKRIDNKINSLENLSLKISKETISKNNIIKFFGCLFAGNIFLFLVVILKLFNVI